MFCARRVVRRAPCGLEVAGEEQDHHPQEHQAEACEDGSGDIADHMIQGGETVGTAKMGSSHDGSPWLLIRILRYAYNIGPLIGDFNAFRDEMFLSLAIKR